MSTLKFFFNYYLDTIQVINVIILKTIKFISINFYKILINYFNKLSYTLLTLSFFKKILISIVFIYIIFYFLHFILIKIKNLKRFTIKFFFLITVSPIIIGNTICCMDAVNQEQPSNLLLASIVGCFLALVTYIYVYDYSNKDKTLIIKNSNCLKFKKKKNSILEEVNAIKPKKKLYYTPDDIYLQYTNQ